MAILNNHSSEPLKWHLVFATLVMACLPFVVINDVPLMWATWRKTSCTGVLPRTAQIHWTNQSVSKTVISFPPGQAKGTTLCFVRRKRNVSVWSDCIMRAKILHNLRLPKTGLMPRFVKTPRDTRTATFYRNIIFPRKVYSSTYVDANLVRLVMKSHQAAIISLNTAQHHVKKARYRPSHKCHQSKTPLLSVLPWWWLASRNKAFGVDTLLWLSTIHKPRKKGALTSSPPVLWVGLFDEGFER